MNKLEAIFEVVRIRQEIREAMEEFASYKITSPMDAEKLAAFYIAEEDREVFLVMMLNTKKNDHFLQIINKAVKALLR